MKRLFKERLLSKQGSVLFIVLVIMSFLIIVASSVFYTVSASRESVVMEYNDIQAFQTANDMLGVVNEYLVRNPANGNAQELTAAIAGLDVVSAMEIWDRVRGNGVAGWSHPLGGLVILDEDGNAMDRADVTVHDLIRTGHFNHYGRCPDPTNDSCKSPCIVHGGHYIRTTSPSNIPAAGDTEIFIFVNERGDIVVEVTVSYGGRTATAQRIYDRNTIDSMFRPKWKNYATSNGSGLGWEWTTTNGGKIAAPSGGWEQVTAPSHRLYGRGTGFSVIEDPEVVGGIAERALGNPAFAASGGAHYARQLCAPYYLGDGWWIMTGNGTSPWDGTSAFTSFCNCVETVRPDGTVREKCSTVASQLTATGFGWVEAGGVNELNMLEWVKGTDWLGRNTTGTVEYDECTIHDGLRVDKCGCCFATLRCSIGIVDSEWKPVHGQPYKTAVSPGVRDENTLDVLGRCLACYPESPVAPTCAQCSRTWSTEPYNSANFPPGNGTCNGLDCSRCPNCSVQWRVDSTGSFPATDSYGGHSWSAASGGGCSSWLTANPCYKPQLPTGPDGGSSIDPVTGHMNYQGPGHTWTQGAAVHVQRKGTDRAEWSRIMSRGITAPTFHDANWTILGTPNNRSFYIEGDVTATGNLLWGSNSHYGLPHTNRTLVITVGGDLHIAGGAPAGAIANAFGSQHANGAVRGNVVVFVNGNVHLHGDQYNKYLNSGVTVYARGTIVTGPSSHARVNQNASDTSVTVNGHTRPVWTATGVEPLGWLNARLNPADNMNDWQGLDAIPYNHHLAFDDWSVGAPSYDTFSGALARYGIDMTHVPNNDKHNVRYISENTTIGVLGGPNMSGSMNVLLIDTGDDPNNTVHIRLDGSGSGTFRWKQKDEQTAKVAIMTLGNGSVVFHVPNNITYGNSMGTYVGPFNLAVSPEAPPNWLDDARLGRLTYAINRQADAAWLRGLLDSTGLGILRPDIATTGVNGIAPRNHSRALNMNVFLVHNGNNPITLFNRNFFAGSVYTPKTQVNATDGGGDNLLLFGSISADSVNIDVMDHVIAMLPGGGVGGAPPNAPPSGTQFLPDLPPGQNPGTLPAPKEQPITPPNVGKVDPATDGSQVHNAGDVNNPGVVNQI
ncbi:MAG: hypothetical protein FWG83_03785 [Oscillospiraceae bacterium]|nr:hypothetical protein [Oscillospiraceae bacterium]